MNFLQLVAYLRSIALVIFDMDGLLLDTESKPKPCWYAIYRTVIMVVEGFFAEANLKDNVPLARFRIILETNDKTQREQTGSEVFGSVKAYQAAETIQKQACDAARTELSLPEERLDPVLALYTVYLTLQRLPDGFQIKNKLEEANVRTFVDFNGLTPEQICERGTKIFGSDDLFQLAKGIRKDACAAVNAAFGIPRMPFVDDVLDVLDQRELLRVIVTAATMEDADIKLDLAELKDRLDRVVGSDVAKSKSERFAKAADENAGKKRGRCVVVGDAPADLECAINAGIPCLIVLDLCRIQDFAEVDLTNPLFIDFVTMDRFRDALREAAK